jgi:hypothetical protein
MYSQTTTINVLPDVRPESFGSLMFLKKYFCELNGNCVHLLVKIIKILSMY